MAARHVSTDSICGDPLNRTRRSILALGGTAASAVALGLSARGPSDADARPLRFQDSTELSGESLLDRWIREKKATLGIFAGGSALAFRDPSTNQIMGYSVEVTQQLMKDIGDVEVEWVELPLAQLFAAVAGGQIQMIGQGLTMLPSRATVGLFAEFPIYYEGVVPWVAGGSPLAKYEDLTQPGVRIAVLAGSSQQYAAELLFPEATLAPFQQIGDSVAEAAVGRADVVLITDHAIAGFADKYPDMRVLEGPPVFVDANSYIVPLNDYRLQAWLTTWARYHATHNTFSTLWRKWVGGRLRDAGLDMKIMVIGTGGEAQQVSIS